MTVHAKHASVANTAIADMPHPVKQVLRSSGRSLDSADRIQMESKFGSDLSHVRIHTDDQAATSANAINAEAYTVANHIAFANSGFGSQLLAHELTHVLQQTAAQGPLLSAGQAEHTARANGHSPANHRTVSGHVAGPLLQKQDAGEKEPARKQAAKAQTPASTVQDQYTKWIEGRIQHRQQLIEATKQKYKRKNWKLTDEDLKPHTDRIAELNRLKTKIKTALSSADAHGQAALTLANVVVNEAGTSNDSAKRAVAYGYMNRIGGAVREPTGKEISGYQKLGDRWAGLDNTGRIIFLDQFADSLDAAVGRLGDNDPTKNDPTKGATHWVSPKGLRKFDPKDKQHKKERYKRTVGTAADRAFPTWARSETDPEVQKMQKKGQLGKKFEELTVPGVTEEEFLFYKDVN